MKKVKLITLFLCAGAGLYSQTAELSIDSCYSLAKKNYPLVKQMALVEKSRDYSLDNAAKGYLPQLNFAGQATYQSEVTKIPISLPGMQIKELSKDQYRVYAEINQSLTDPFIIQQQKELIRFNSEAEKEKLEVEFYKLKERINQLYFGILLIDAQMVQADLLIKDLLAALRKTEAAISNGTAMKSNSNLLQAELLKTGQRITELKTARKGYAEMLSLFIHQPLTDNVTLVMPKVLSLSNDIHRPELNLLELQKRGSDIQNKLLLARNLPKVSLFFQGGYGRPTLNMLSNDFGTYYIGGLRFNWNITGFYTYKKEKQLQTINQNGLDVQKETFLFNTNLALKQQNTEADKWAQLLESDTQIIQLREQVKNTANAQLENGTITAIDYLSTLNAEDQARQNLSVHKIQLLLAQYNHQTTSGN